MTRENTQYPYELVDKYSSRGMYDQTIPLLLPEET